MRFEKRKLALQTESENAFEYIAREWHQMKSTKWSAGYASDIMEAFQSDIYLMWVRASRINQTARKYAKYDNVARKFFAMPLLWAAEFNPSTDLSSAPEAHQSNHFPLLSLMRYPIFCLP